MISFVHTADAHFGVENYGKIDHATGLHSRLLDFHKSFNKVIDFAIEKKVDFFLFCGDAYKTAHPTPTQQKLFLQSLMRLYNAQIPVVIVVGNHDHPLSFGKANSLSIFEFLPLDGFYLFDKPDIFKIPTKNGLVQIVGIPWPTRNNVVALQNHRFKDDNELSNYLVRIISDIILQRTTQLDPRIPSILAGHLTVTNAVFSGSEKLAIWGNDPAFPPSSLAVKPFDYVALGHLHRYQNLGINGGIPVVYSGSIDRIDFGERKEKKGFCYVSIDPEKSFPRTSFRFIEIDVRPMLFVDLFLKKQEDQTEQIVKELRKLNLKDAILKICYHLDEMEEDKVDLSVVYEACKDAYYIVDIAPIRKRINRTRRNDIKIDMDIRIMIERYMETKDLERDERDRILKKALSLYADLGNP